MYFKDVGGSDAISLVLS